MIFDAYAIASVKNAKTFIEITYIDNGETEVPGCECILIGENAQMKMNLEQDAAAIWNDVVYQILWIDQLDMHTFKLRLDIHEWVFQE